MKYHVVFLRRNRSVYALLKSPLELPRYNSAQMSFDDIRAATAAMISAAPSKVQIS